VVQGVATTVPQSKLDPLGAAVHQSAGWDYFNERVCPGARDWQRIWDREAVSRLVSAGADPDAPFELWHTLLASAAGIETLWNVLEPEGFIRLAHDHNLVVAYSQPLSDLSRVTSALYGLCARVGAAYDGWAVPS
jgi:hypothetical protein